MSQGISSAFADGIEEFFFVELEEYPPGYADVYHMLTMDTPFRDEQGMQGYDLPVPRMPGVAVTFNSFSESFNVRYVPDTISSADSIPEEDLDDAIYPIFTRMLPAMGGAFSRSFRTYKELFYANILINFGFVSGTVLYGPDRVSLWSQQHPVSRQNNSVFFSTRPSADMDFSVGAYNIAYTNLLTQPAPDNLQILPNAPDKLVYYPSQRTIVEQVLKSVWQPNTADRNDNVIRKDRVTPVMWPYWRKSGSLGATYSPQAYNAWFILGKRHYLKAFTRAPFRIKTDSDLITNSQVFFGQERLAGGWSDARGTFGSTGL